MSSMEQASTYLLGTKTEGEYVMMEELCLNLGERVVIDFQEARWKEWKATLDSAMGPEPDRAGPPATIIIIIIINK